MIAACLYITYHALYYLKSRLPFCGNTNKITNQTIMNEINQIKYLNAKHEQKCLNTFSRLDHEIEIIHSEMSKLQKPNRRTKQKDQDGTDDQNISE